MENARVGIIEDDTHYVNILANNLEGTGHCVIEHARTLSEGTDLIERILSKQLDIDVVFLDGNLHGGEDGNNARELMELAGFPDSPQIPIIGFSQLPFSSYGLEPTADATKRGWRQTDGFAGYIDNIDTYTT